MTPLELTQEQIADHMDDILKMFKPGAKVTVLVRNPSIPGDADLLMTNDELHEVLIAIQRRQAQGPSEPKRSADDISTLKHE